MNARLLGILVVALFVLGGGALWLHQRDSAAPAVTTLGEPLLKDLQASGIASIRITEPGATITLRRDGERWVIAERGDFPADFTKVRNFVLAALALKIGQSEPIGPAERTRLRLDEPTAKEGGGTLVVFGAGADKPLASVIVGRKYFRRTPDDPKNAKGDGRFVLRPDAANTAIIVADPLEQAGAKSALWIDRRAFAADEPISIDVRHADGDHWHIERGPNAGDKWKLADLKPGEKLAENTVVSIAAAAGGLDLAEVFARDAQREAKALAKPTVITTVTRDGLTYTLKVGDEGGGNRLAVGTIQGKLPAARKPVPGEKPEEATARDKAFAERSAKTRTRLPGTETLNQHAFLIPTSTLFDLTKKRAELLEKPPAKP